MYYELICESTPPLNKVTQKAKSDIASSVLHSSIISLSKVFGSRSKTEALRNGFAARCETVALPRRPDLKNNLGLCPIRAQRCVLACEAGESVKSRTPAGLPRWGTPPWGMSPRNRWFWIEEPVITGDRLCDTSVARYHGLGLCCFLPGAYAPGFVRLKAQVVGEVKVLFRYTLSGL